MSIEETVKFYTAVLNMGVLKFCEDRIALKFGNHKIKSCHKDNVVKQNVKNAMPRPVDICSITKDSIEDVIEHVKSQSINIEIGPVERTEALGKIISIFLRNPDENLIEFSNYQ
ncbi:VOC family protein [Staphylococcus gallinarum]|uniref:VOC family protein n=1 Tax=Staphylococcus gallinarum TaxID=1293 RepID=UPI00316C5737